MNRFSARVISKCKRTAATYLFRRKINLQLEKPIVSFSFDDAPLTAFTIGREILNRYGVFATYYMALGKLGTNSPSGIIASVADLKSAAEEGHELGCHTYDHHDSWETKKNVYVASVLRNRTTLLSIFPEMNFKSFAYPLCEPHPFIKREMGNLFWCCRGGGQTFNNGITDLCLLKAFFLDSKVWGSMAAIKEMIDENARSCGWLIFATHDVDDHPSRYGCTREFFEEIVGHAIKSRAETLPIGKAYEKIIRVS